MLKQIRKLDFGAPAAERDLNKGLKDYFIYTGAFQRLKDNQKSVILGNRGAGKSALIKMLSDHYKKIDAVVVELIPENYSYEILKSATLAEKDELWAKQTAYTSAWKYLIYVLAMKQYSHEHKTVLKTQAKNIHAFLRDNFKHQNLDKFDVFVSYLKRIDGIKIGPYEAGIKIQELQSLYKLEEINSLIPELVGLAERKPILILIDELDKGWDSSDDAKAFVSGLFQAGISINELTPNLRVIISLRRELYDDIPSLYDDYQKHSDLFEVLEWDEKSLFDLIVKRIKHSLPELKHLPKKEAWKTIFSENINSEDSFEYIVGRTLYRPREIIQFCSEAKDRCIETRRDKIDINSIVSSEAKYSLIRAKDIAAEHRFQHPGLQDVFEAFRGARSILTRNELEAFCQKMINNEIKTGSNTEWLKSQNEDYLINILFQVGFLRAKAIAYTEHGNKEGFWGPHQISLPNLGNVTSFSIHPMFWLYLGISNLEIGD